MRSAILMLAVTLAFGLCGCGGGGGRSAPVDQNSSPAIFSRAQAQQHCAWTVLVYLDADNDLESVGITNLNQMEKIGSTQDVHVIVQMDRTTGHDTSNGDWTDTRRYLVTRDTDTERINSLRLDSPQLGEKDMGDWHTLREFVQWGVTNFPADHYCVVLWDHGTGWQFRTLSAVPRFKYIATDDSSGSAIDVTSLPNALEGLNISVLAFDACLMAQFEVAYEVKDCANYMVASAASEPSAGYDYYAWLRRVSATMDGSQMCQAIVSAYAASYPSGRQAITQSAVDLTKVQRVADAASTYAQLLATNPRWSTGLRNARVTSLNYSTADGGDERHFHDLIDYAGKCATVVGPSANSAFASLNSAVTSAIVAETHSNDLSAARGLGIYVPPPGNYDGNYSELTFASSTQWDEWLTSQAQ